MSSSQIQAREQVCQIDGMRVLVREVGEGSPVLLINGIGAHTGMWAPLEQALTGFHLIEFDAPGTGRSQTPRLPRSVRSMARLAAGVLDAVEVQQADVIGYSLGGVVGQELAASAPERVRRLVLAATTCGLGAVPGEPAAMLNLATPLRYWSRTFYSRTLGSLAGGKARNNPEFVASHGEERLRHRPSMQGYTGQMIGAATWSTLPSLQRITAPTLIVMGDDDPLVPPANGALLSEWISESRLLVAPGEGHLLLMDPQSAVLEPIRQFLGTRNVGPAPIGRDQDVSRKVVRNAVDIPALYHSMINIMEFCLAPGRG
jgi:poly(3-hydroxyoctanoate) depolymerase